MLFTIYFALLRCAVMGWDLKEVEAAQLGSPGTEAGSAGYWRRVSKDLRAMQTAQRLDTILHINLSTNDTTAADSDRGGNTSSGFGIPSSCNVSSSSSSSERGPELVRFIEEPAAGALGIVVKIPVARKIASPLDGSNSRDSLTISWLVRY